MTKPDYSALGERDSATVTPEGIPLDGGIAGVRIGKPVNHVDHRGRLFEVWSSDDPYWQQPFVYSYCFSVRPNTTKGWGVHDHKFDRYVLISGEVVTVLFDGRSDSPTFELEQRVALSGQGVRQLTIPPGVWHININVGADEAFLLNFPTEPYIYERPDRRTLPFDSPDIPVDVRRYFPTQSR